MNSAFKDKCRLAAEYTDYIYGYIREIRGYV